MKENIFNFYNPVARDYIQVPISQCGKSHRVWEVEGKHIHRFYVYTRSNRAVLLTYVSEEIYRKLDIEEHV